MLNLTNNSNTTLFNFNCVCLDNIKKSRILILILMIFGNSHVNVYPKLVQTIEEYEKQMDVYTTTFCSLKEAFQWIFWMIESTCVCFLDEVANYMDIWDFMGIFEISADRVSHVETGHKALIYGKNNLKTKQQEA